MFSVVLGLPTPLQIEMDCIKILIYDSARFWNVIKIWTWIDIGKIILKVEIIILRLRLHNCVFYQKNGNNNDLLIVFFFYYKTYWKRCCVIGRLQSTLLSFPRKTQTIEMWPILSFQFLKHMLNVLMEVMKIGPRTKTWNRKS